MTDREKLSELLNENFCKYCNVDIIAGNCKISAITFDVDRFADFLISNGVTFQTWIPVSERLPEVGGNYLVAVKYKYDFEKEYSYDTDYAEFTFADGYIDNHWNTYNDWDEGQQYLHVTHWMPIPEAPKEES